MCMHIQIHTHTHTHTHTYIYIYIHPTILKCGLHFTSRAHLSLDWPHFKYSIAPCGYHVGRHRASSCPSGLMTVEVGWEGKDM